MVLAALHVPAPVPEQQAKPKSPHLVHTPLLQLVPGAVHAPPVEPALQQGNPAPPHVPHTPALQVPPPKPTQIPPGCMQIPDTQQPPPVQALPAHGRRCCLRKPVARSRCMSAAMPP